MRKIFLIYLLFKLSFFYGQDLNCEITIDARQTGQENLQVFKSLENQLNEFINNNSRLVISPVWQSDKCGGYDFSELVFVAYSGELKHESWIKNSFENANKK